MKRLFLAIKIYPNENMLRTYNSIKKSLSYNKIRWVNPSNFHLTVKFFGDTYEDSISVVNKVIIDTINEFSSFDIEIKNTGIFGSRYNPRVIWFGITENEKLSCLANELVNNLDVEGFKNTRQNFVPHISIGRITKIEDKKLFNYEISKVKYDYYQKSEIKELILFESILSSKGPTYNVVNRYKLK